jgi:hypothetical protein
MDKIDVCNMALSRIGIDNIEALTEPSEPARACSQFYDHCRRVVLRKYPWTWATRRVQLAEITDKPQDFSYAYRYPASCLALRKLYNEHFDNIPAYTGYQIVSDKEGRAIYTDVANVSAEYTADIDDTGLFDEQFIEALSWKLAGSIAFKLTGNAQLPGYCDEQYMALFLDAAANNEDEQNMRDKEPYTLIAARFGGDF